MVEYLSGGRIQGSSTADTTIVASSSDITDLSWTEVGSSGDTFYIVKDTSNDRIDVKASGNCGTESSPSVGYATLSDTLGTAYWRMRFKLVWDSSGVTPESTGGKSFFTTVGIKDNATSQGSAGSGNGFAFSFGADAGSTQTQFRSQTSGTVSGTATQNPWNPTNDTIYCEITWDGGTATGKIFTSSDYSTTQKGSTVTKTGTFSGLKYVQIGLRQDTGGNGVMEFTMSNLEIINRQDEKDSLTNVPANTRYEETDTRKIYRAGSVEPVFHYKFSEASGDVINHGSVASSNLTVNSLTRDQSTPSGLGNGMKTPNEDSGYAENTSNINDYKFMHDGTSKWSVSFWLKCYDVPQNASGYSTEHLILGNIWTDDNGIGFTIRLAMNNSPTSTSKARIQTLIADGDAGMPLNDQSPNDMMPDTTDWHFYCVTYDPTLNSNNLTVTRDASTSGTGFHQGDYDDVAYSTSNPTRKTTYMARPTSGGNAYDNGVMGTMAQIIIWKGHILTQAEKVSLYASGNGTTTLPSPLEWKERNTA